MEKLRIAQLFFGLVFCKISTAAAFDFDPSRTRCGASAGLMMLAGCT
ncbi:hypothetical protein CAter10_3641 [Collimonas arenae]|nr:hypothetical protein CAter10_3641 [Collimonas arenae]